MSEKKQPESSQILETYSKVQSFYMKNLRIINIIGSVLIVIIFSVVLMKAWYIPKQNEKALGEMWRAEQNFKRDSFNLALNGDIMSKGFLQIIDKGSYRFTKAKKLAHLYAGLCYLNLKDFDNAISHLRKYKSSDMFLGALALGSTADAYAEKGEFGKAEKYYRKAAAKNENDFTSAMYLYKLALLYEKQNKNEEAAEVYQQIREDYPNSDVAADIDKYIIRAEIKAGI